MPSPRPPRLGIGITTYERRGRLEQVVEALKAHTRTPHRLLIADDGSSDGTVAYLRERRLPHLAAQNRGVAWNKNRLLFHLSELDRCEVILLLEDDTVPSADGWEKPWIECALRYGHMNYAGPWMLDQMISGAGTSSDPYISEVCSGQCAVFSRIAVDAVGYMDTRFKRYGFEHGEHTGRMVRAGYGGDPKTRNIFLIDSALTVFDGGKSRFEADLATNGEIFTQVSNDLSLFRPAARTNDEKRSLISEMKHSVLYDNSRKLKQMMRLFLTFAGGRTKGLARL